MFQGFYDLAANMITQNRKMNVISNNMANVSTPGFKSDKLIETTFRDEMIYTLWTEMEKHQLGDIQSEYCR